MATFSGRNSPTALAALAPSINNLAAARNAKSQAAAGLVKTMGVQFEKQREKEARKQKNQAAQQVAEKLLQDPAFRRQAPGITDSAGLVKLVGADNVVKFGLETQQADRVAQESATRINLTKKQIKQYDVDTRKRESDEASGKAFSTAVVGMFGEGYTQEDMLAAIQGMNSSDAASFVGVYNERNPQDPLQEITVGDKKYLYSSKSGNAMLVDDGSQLDKETESRLAAIDQMNISPEEKEKMKQGVLRFAAIPRDEYGDPAPGFGVGAAGVPAGGAGGVPAGGPGGGGPGGPTGDPPARITLEGNSNLQTLFDKMGEDVLENPEKVDGYLFQYRDKLSDEEKETFKRFVVQESIVTAEEKRKEELNARIEANNPDKPGVVESYLKNLTIPGFSGPISSMIPGMDVLRKANQDKANELESYIAPGAAGKPGLQLVKGIKDYMMGGESQSSTPPPVNISIGESNLSDSSQKVLGPIIKAYNNVMAGRNGKIIPIPDDAQFPGMKMLELAKDAARKKLVEGRKGKSKGQAKKEVEKAILELEQIFGDESQQGGPKATILEIIASEYPGVRMLRSAQDKFGGQP